MAVPLPGSLVEKLRKLKEIRDDQDTVVKKINKFHSRLSETTREKAEKYSDKLWQKLREYYVNAKKLAEQEEKLCGQCIAELESLGLPPGIISLPPAAASQPNAPRRKSQGEVRRPKPKQGESNNVGNGNASSGTPSPAGDAKQGPSQRRVGPGGDTARVPVSVPGETVAARISPQDAEKDDWILVKVLSYSADTDTYEVFDEEPGEDDDPGQKKYSLDSSCIIPLPKDESAHLAPDFPAGSHVLAVYPTTTSLYRATVVVGLQPRKNKEDDYFLEFDDDEDPEVDGLPQRRVPFHHVVTLPTGHKQ